MFGSDLLLVRFRGCSDSFGGLENSLQAISGYHDRGTRSRANSDIKKPFDLVMCSPLESCIVWFVIGASEVNRIRSGLKADEFFDALFLVKNLF